VSERPLALEVRPFPVIFAAPSGAGKTSIAQALRSRRDDIAFSISATTRPPRHYERDGVDYFFRSEEEFRGMIEAGELLEWARVHGNYYGTPRRNLDDAVGRGHFLILDIDVQGSRQVRELVPDAVSIFVLPPSGDELARRLVGRGSEDPAVQERRLRAARDELGAVTEFDYVIVNHDVQHSVDVVEQILAAERHRVRRAPALPESVRELGLQVDRCLESIGRGSGPSTSTKE
jgi:guanylate kinase